MLSHREPDDQVPRKLAYEAAHPDIRITYRATHWEAVIPHEDGNGETIVTRYELRQLLDKLEEP